MSYNWINAKEYTMDALLLFDRWIICCNGDDEFKRTAPDKKLIHRGFEYFSHESVEGGIIYDYRKKVIKK